uniref:deazapurine DNA modification protein DpdA family protein n=1 Tax=Actinophytocola xanthii TaxID=1912961 RepID=UPI0013011142|nr:hypothetical protein [Actinophytocola xanthii]
MSLRTMEKYRDDWDNHPKAFVSWILDSGAYTEISKYGEWRYDPDLFGSVVTRVLDNVATPPAFCAPQDYPCETGSLSASGLTVAEHQEFTIESECYLRSEFRHVPWIPVLQGWKLSEYVDHVARYLAAGIDLTSEPLVGLGSVCRRTATHTVDEIITTLHGMGIRLHGFGVHRSVLARCGHLLYSADSMGWSRSARWRSRAMPGCDHEGNCTNCAEFASRWYHTTLDVAERSHVSRHRDRRRQPIPRRAV